MAATELRGVTGLWQRVAAFAGSLLAMGGAKAIELPENRAEGLYHLYKGGGVTADGPALLVRKSIADKVSLSGSYYVDAVSNASIDVVTTASPFKETRKAYEFGIDTLVRDSIVSATVSRSKEPDYIADAASLDVSHEVFGGMTTVSLGFTRASDRVGKRESGVVNWLDEAHHWQYRLGLTQILTPQWRVGYIAAAPELAQRFIDTKLLGTLTTPSLFEDAVALCLEQGVLRRHADRVITRLDAARARTVRLVRDAGLRFASPPQGLFGWVDVGCDTDRLAQALLDEGCLIAPGSLFHARQRPTTLMRVNFAVAQDARFWRRLHASSVVK